MDSHFSLPTLLLVYLCFYNSLHSCQGTLTIDPTTACVGDRITVSCSLDVPNANDDFFSVLTEFIVGTSDIGISESAVDGTGTHGGVDLSKLVATAPAGTSKSVSGTITLLSYTTDDNGTRLGCSNEYYINGDTNNRATVSENTTILAAVIPSTPIVTVSTTDCTNTLINWTAPDNNERIDYYIVYRNNTFIINTTSTTYTDTELLNVGTNYQYSVIASNCAGNSTEGIGNSIIKVAIKESALAITYDSYTNIIEISWSLLLETESPPLTIQYYLSLMYTYTLTNNVTVNYSNTSFYQISTNNQIMDTLSFATNDSVESLFIRACINVTEQCGIIFIGRIACVNYNSSAPTPTTPTISTPSTTRITAVSAMPTVASNQGSIIGALIGVVAAILCCFCFIAVVITIVIIYFQKKGQGTSKSRGNLENIEGDDKETKTGGIAIGGIKPQGFPPQKELLYADLDLVASHTGTVNQTVEETHYMRVKPTYDGPNK